MRKKLNGYYNYTVILTYIGMLTGFTGIALAFRGEHRLALICLMLSGLCDMFDGAIASTRKRTESEKRFGIQIDSLSDLICFGVLPALISYCICDSCLIALAVGGLYVLCALIRLAYFNVMEELRQNQETGRRTGYQGLPVTTSALLLPLAYMVSLWLNVGAMLLLLTVLGLTALAFLLPFRVPKPHGFGILAMTLVGACEFVLLLMNFSPIP